MVVLPIVMGREGGAIPSILVAPEVVLLSIFVLVSRGALFLCTKHCVVVHFCVMESQLEMPLCLG